MASQSGTAGLLLVETKAQRQRGWRPGTDIGIWREGHIGLPLKSRLSQAAAANLYSSAYPQYSYQMQRHRVSV